MTPKENKNVNDAPSREELENSVFSGIMALSENKRNQILRKYAERYGWYVE